MDKNTSNPGDLMEADEDDDDTGAELTSEELAVIPANATEKSALDRLSGVLNSIDSVSNISVFSPDDMRTQLESYESIRDGLASVFDQIASLGNQRVLIAKEIKAHTSHVNSWYYRKNKAKVKLEGKLSTEDREHFQDLLNIAEEQHSKFLRERKILRIRAKATSNVIKTAHVARTQFLTTALSGYSTSSVALLSGSNVDLEDYREQIRSVVDSVELLKSRSVDPSIGALKAVEAQEALALESKR